MTRRLLGSLLLLTACGAGDQVLDTPDADPAPLPVAHEFPPIPIAAGQEISSQCQSWTVGNDEPLYVNAVDMQAGPGFHHSNWFFVPEDSFAGEDGTWRCSDRDFDTVEAALVGGVLYAQSTQVTAETQQFRPGAAVIVPARSKLVGEVHLLNAGDVPLEPTLRLELRPLRQSEVDTVLLPLELHYFPLRLPAQQRSSFGADCDYEAAYGGPITFSVHYVMPHYHQLGTGMRLEILGGDRDGEAVYQTEGAIGEPLGGTLAEPISLAGARGMRFRCDYDNPRETAVGWGIGDNEMCMALVFTDSEVMWAGGVESGRESLGLDGDVARFGGACDLYTLRARN